MAKVSLQDTENDMTSDLITRYSEVLEQVKEHMEEKEIMIILDVLS